MNIADMGLISHAVAAAAFLALAVLVLLSWRRGPVGAWLVAATSATVLWAGATAFDFWSDHDHATIVAVLEVVRTGGWLGFLATVLFLNRMKAGMSAGGLATAIGIGVPCLVVIFLDIAGPTTVRAWLPTDAPDGALFGRLILAVGGLLMVENLLRNASPNHRWNIKFLCFGIGGLFAYDFFMYADALLFYRVSEPLVVARGVTNALIVPLIAVSARRNPDWSIDVFVSRRMVFHSATLVGAGVYLLAMAAVGFYLREYGGEWGPMLQAVFLFAAAILLLLILFSGSFRARLMDAISKHFFSYKYDYRDEWLRFISTISETESGVGLPHRIVAGIAAIVESPQGALWFYRSEGRFTLLERWNLGAPEGDQTVDPSFIKFLEERQTVINLERWGEQPEAYPGLQMPQWLSDIRRGWLIVPLLHHDRLLGFLLLVESRAPRNVDREDYVLLTTVGRQSASYLAEATAASALAEAQQFDEFNRRFAFVLHDIKNLVSQLSLLVQNAEKHKDKPAFQHDMLQTVKESVVKMNRLLVRLHEGGRETAAAAPVRLEPLLRKAVHRRQTDSKALRLESDVDGIAVAVDEERLGAVVGHLIDNALEAVADGGRVTVKLYARGGDAVLEVEDNGPGMDKDFIESELFRPFRTTKLGGFGIGAYESREFVREHGGRMDVNSAPGEGTVVRISLPATVVGARLDEAH